MFILLFLLFFIGCQSAVIISKDSNEVNNKENITNEITTNTNSVYYVQNTKRGKLLILKDPILFDSNSSVVNTNKYAETLDYLSLVLKSTNILNIYIEGHIDSSEVRYMNKNTVYNLSTTNNILYLYDRNNEVDLSYLRSLAVGDLLTDNDNKLKAIGLQNLIDYGTPEQNRRVEFVIIENSNDMYMYTNYIYNLY
ncbi:hypothetical protein [Brachyspira pilosicoli]|uniref:hypothetical protein n=1 Tax=Brachyspira pilosicoli TaxID=52584 RepID=UPI0027E5A935|nr:hypothetical protein [Brachyspira pilosicoli]